jgi:hypothetical protein
MSWHFGGQEEAEEYLKEQERKRAEQEKQRANWVPRLYLPVGATANITIVDNDLEIDPRTGKKPPILYYEHQYHLNGRWNNFFTCSGRGCKMCKNGNRASFVGAYSAIHHDKWEDKQGTIHENELILVVVKSFGIKELARQSKKRGGLLGAQFEVTRTDSKQPNSGGAFDFEGKVETVNYLQEKVPIGNITPIDYMKVLAPKSDEEIMKILGAEKAENEDDIPF